MRAFISIVLVLGLFACVSPKSTPSKAQPHTAIPADAPYVVLVSIDGYRFDYTKKFSPPRLSALAKEGASAKALIPSFPSKTFPNHLTIVTGLYPEHHGIVSNSFYDFSRPRGDQFYSIKNRQAVADGSWYGGEPIWVAAEKQGMLSGIYFWPGSEAAIQGVRPTYYKTYDDKVPDDERVAQVLSWLRLPQESRPHFLSLYFSDVDGAGHEFGTQSTELKGALSKVDRSIGLLLDGLKSLSLPVNVIVVSDHGMQDMDAAKTIALDDLTDLSGLTLSDAGPVVSIYDTSQSPGKIERVYSDLKKRAKHFSVFHRSETPPRLHYSKNNRIGDLVILAESPYSIGTRSTLTKFLRGNHGYDPTQVATMKGIFYAEGPQIRKGVTLKPFENIHIYPLIMKILGLKPAAGIDGDEKVLAPIRHEGR